MKLDFTQEWVEKYSLKVHIAIGVAFLAVAFALVMVLVIVPAHPDASPGTGILPVGVLTLVGGIILWRAKDRIQRGDD